MGTEEATIQGRKTRAPLALITRARGGGHYSRKEDNIITRAMYLRGGGHYSRKEDNIITRAGGGGHYSRKEDNIIRGSVYVCYSNLLYCGGWGEGDIFKINFLSSFPFKTL